MWRNYFKTAYRHLLRHRTYTLISVSGLTVGIACCLLIFLYVQDELSFDRFHEKSDRIHRAWVDEDYGEGRTYFATNTPVPLAPALEASYPEVEEAVRVETLTDRVRRGEQTFNERVHLVDPAFFSVFSFPLQRGQPDQVLGSRHNVVLTPEIAARYFGEEDPMGQSISIQVGDDWRSFTVTGIAAPPPSNSSIQFEMLIPYEHAHDRRSEAAQTSWFQIFGETYVLLADGTSTDQFEAKLPTFVQEHVGEYDEVEYTIGMQAMTDIRLNPDFPAGLEPISDPLYVYLLAAMALLVLIIASINFTTLSLGQSAKRSLEVGVRKALGADRWRLIQQFWSETLLLVSSATLFGLIVAGLALPFFNNLAGRELTLTISLSLLLFLAAVVVVIGLLASSYPALVLSGFNPASVLRSRAQATGSRSWVRKGLVVTQFSLSILLIIATLFVGQQLDYLQTANLGFDKDQVLIVRTGETGSAANALLMRMQSALDRVPEVSIVGHSAFALDEPWAAIDYENDGIYREFRLNWASEEFPEAVGLDLAAGRTFSRERSDSTAILVNETLVRQFNLENPVGSRLPGDRFGDHEIIGVVRDFHFSSLRSEIEPMVLAIDPNPILQGASNVSVGATSQRKQAIRFDGRDVRTTVDEVRGAWSSVAGGADFDYYFLDQAVDAQYQQEERLSRIAATASILSIIIASMGLFGLAMLTVVRRTKEVGVRKVLGASTGSIIALVSKDFAWLVLIAFALAMPVAYWGVNRWLEGFAYRITIGPGTFLLAGALALLIAMATVSFHAYKAATMDPVRAIKQE